MIPPKTASLLQSEDKSALLVGTPRQLLQRCSEAEPELGTPRQLLSAPLQWGPEAEPELGGREVARLAVGAVGARAPVDMLKALARCVVDIGQARLGYDSGDVARGAQGDVLVVDSVWPSVKVNQFRWAAPPEHLVEEPDRLLVALIHQEQAARVREERGKALTLVWHCRRGAAGVPGVELTIAPCPVGATNQAFAISEEPLNILDDFLVKVRFDVRMEVEVKRQGPRERRAHHRCVTDGVTTRDWARERVEVDLMPHDDLRRVLCVELWTFMEAWTIMCLECLAASCCILKDHAAERCTARLWHVLDEQVLTTCQRP